MRSFTALTIKLMIRKYGEDVQHKRRVKTDLGGGEAEYTYEVQEPKRIHWSEISPLDTTVYPFGNRIEADFIATALPNTDIMEYDLLYFNDSWNEVITLINHKTGTITDYMEFLIRRRNT